MSVRPGATEPVIAIRLPVRVALSPPVADGSVVTVASSVTWVRSSTNAIGAATSPELSKWSV